MLVLLKSGKLKRSGVRCSPSSLDSLAQGCCVLLTGNGLGSYAGILTDGFFPADARAAFDEAEPMVVVHDESAGPTERRNSTMLMYAQFYMFGGQKDTEVKESKKTKR